MSQQETHWPEFVGGPLDGDPRAAGDWPAIWCIAQPDVSGVRLRGQYRYEKAKNGNMWFVDEVDRHGSCAP